MLPFLTDQVVDQVMLHLGNKGLDPLIVTDGFQFLPVGEIDSGTSVLYRNHVLVHGLLCEYEVVVDIVAQIFSVFAGVRLRRYSFFQAGKNPGQNLPVLLFLSRKLGKQIFRLLVPDQFDCVLVEIRSVLVNPLGEFNDFTGSKNIYDCPPKTVPARLNDKI